ncbi:MAG: HNH endonuclease [Saprospiraceae bacterium]|nr:HNH endonuclease [Saprospiraceae bacterium]MCF8250789.1 HNH endonuclease [Saprospiraceae bacterium]MCF8281767.1 HNH endonuclease [Bacteroidales bacterium]MCF8312590.1 HNH endonuclease [Saprospiraceae bacterium]MCF8440919.1 HNH endonuclease [Saprospiraceae bacterium]
MPTNYISAELRRLVKLRANNNCEYCQALGGYSFHQFPVEHIIPISKGGNDEETNLANACQFCNGSKLDKTESLDPLTGMLVSLFNPRTQAWSENFVWSDDFTLIIGITPIGRATVNCLKMNREAAINLRAALRSFGVHPPKQ